ncbi:uncharacterized protein LOC142339207 isoform X2 [Convolutriloba macropyga]|uniref:uncharacterized protein LOC142339207 isoform X2 n=1 Tax=Convolutriloba macropyga TaxID=536237 RepID=UPI003F522FB2
MGDENPNDAMENLLPENDRMGNEANESSSDGQSLRNRSSSSRNGSESSNTNNNDRSQNSTLQTGEKDCDSGSELAKSDNPEEHLLQSCGNGCPTSLKENLFLNSDNGKGSDCVIAMSTNGFTRMNSRSITNPYNITGPRLENDVYFRRAAALNKFRSLQTEYKSDLKKKTGKTKQKLKHFYTKQDDFISAIVDAEDAVSKSKDDADNELKATGKAVKMAAKLSFIANVILMIAKLVASYLSGSMAIISSLVDSVVDLVSGAVIFYTTRAAKRTNFYSYPFGRTRLEPAAIIIISVVMGLASFQVQIQSLQQIITWSANPHVDIWSKLMVFVTIVMKLLLFFYCRRIDSPSTKTLATDHFNDVIGNSFALACGWVGSTYAELKVVDPIGAILISFYICYNWWKTGSDQIKVITGRTAPPFVLAKITWLSLYHHEKIKNIDTVRAFHLGSGFLTEVHITLDENMTLREAHDIGESLQNKLELLQEVEVAFVHLDYENDHKASTEHAFLMRKPSEAKKPTPRSRTVSANTNA